MGSVFLRGESWVGEYKDRGKVKRKTFGRKGVITKTLAREMLRRLERQVKLGQYEMLDDEIPIFNEFANEYLVHGKEVIKKRSWWRDVYGLKHFILLFGDRRLFDSKVLGRLSFGCPKPNPNSPEMNRLRYKYLLEDE